MTIFMDIVGSGGGGSSVVAVAVVVAAAVTVVVVLVVVVMESLSIDDNDNSFVEQASDHTGREMDGILVITIVLGGGGGGRFVRCLESTATDMAFVSYVTDVIHSNNHNVGTTWNWNNHNRFYFDVNWNNYFGWLNEYDFLFIFYT